MEIRNFSEFLLEKKKDKSESEDSAPLIKDMSKKEINSLEVDEPVSDEDGEIEVHGFKIVVDNKKVESKENIKTEGLDIWKPGGGPWFLEYFSQIKSEKDPVNITEEVLLKLGEEGFSNIGSSFVWEKLYQFAKYCLTGKPDGDYAGKYFGVNLLEKILDIVVEGKTIRSILNKGIKNDDITTYTQAIYENIKKFIKGLDENEFKLYFLHEAEGGEKLGENEKKDNERDLKILKDFNDTSIISLLAGLYQPKDKAIFVTDSTFSRFKNRGEEWADEKTERDASKKWPADWSIPIDPLRVKDLIINSESCVNQSKACLGQIKILLSNESRKGVEEKMETIFEACSKMLTLREKLLGKQEEEEGEETGVIYAFWKKFNADKITDADKIKLIKEGGGLTEEMSVEFLNNFKGVKGIIQEAKNLVDSGEMSKEEYFRNVETYTEDNDGKSVSAGEGLKKVMYGEIKDGISDIQAAIDNYTSAPGEKNALEQFLKVYNEFIDKTKSQYTITGGDIKVKK
jgi:hypothetical protein